MAIQQPEPITATEHRRRVRRVKRIARHLGFLGRVEYRHVLSKAGGAQYGMGASPGDDLLVVYAEAFLKDADPEDFSLEAVIAHERGHQAVCRDIRWQRLLAGTETAAAEEVLASVVGSLLVEDPTDREDLVLKAIHDAVRYGLSLDEASCLVFELRRLLEKTR